MEGGKSSEPPNFKKKKFQYWSSHIKESKVTPEHDHTTGPDFLKMIDRIWSIIDSWRKLIELKIARKKINNRLIAKNWSSINVKKKLGLPYKYSYMRL